MLHVVEFRVDIMLIYGCICGSFAWRGMDTQKSVHYGNDLGAVAIIM